MTKPDPSLLELAALIRGALVLADSLDLMDVSIGLDSALNNLAARDSSGTILPMPFDPHHDLDDLDVDLDLGSHAA